MVEVTTFQPPRRLGMVTLSGAMALLALTGAVGLWQATLADIGPTFILFLLPSFLAFAAIPFLAYRVYALQNAHYTLEREGVRLQWGLRGEVIPIQEILWMHPAAGIEAPLPLPLLRLPGGVLGVRRFSGAEGEGGAREIEYLASSTRGLILIATQGRIYAISPADPKAFLRAFQIFTEMGSLTPLAAHSVYPTFLVSQVWASAPARLLLVGSVSLSLALLVWVSLAIPGRATVNLGFHPDGSAKEAVPAVQMLLLPVVNTIFVLGSILLGLFFYRRQESQPLSYVLWGSSALTPLLFLLAAFTILR